MTRVSVIVPTFNRSAILGKALGSVRAQTFSDFEVLVVDDGSTEDIGAAVAAIEDQRFSCLRHTENQGAPAARNTGLAVAKGEFVAFLDSDDLWAPNKLALQIAMFETGPPDLGIVYGGYHDEDRGSLAFVAKHRGDLSETLLLGNCIGGTSLPLIRRSLLQQVGGFDESLPSCQDWDLWIRLARICKADFVSQELVVNWVQIDSITRNQAASINGHRMLVAKHSQAIAALPRTKRARHHIYIGELMFWKRAFSEAARQFGQALLCDPLRLREVHRFLVWRPIAKRLLRALH